MSDKHDDAYLWDRTGEPDEDVQRLEALLAPLAHDGRVPVRLVSPPRRRRGRLAVAAVLAVGLGLGSWALWREPGTPPLALLRRSLTAGTERLGEDAWIDADAGDVELALGERMGRITLEAGGRLQVRRLDAEVTRLYLDRGRLEASIAADVRPRFFQVDTPATRCVDLGCRYTLEVDENGGAFVDVLTGRVAFESRGDEVYVPANATCRASRDGRAGTPRFRDTPAELVEALDAYDAAAGGEADARLRFAQAVCDRSQRVEDTLGVWHLLRDPDARIVDLAQAALVRLAGFDLEVVPTTREGWKRELEWLWT